MVPYLRDLLWHGIDQKSVLPALFHQQALSIDPNQVESVIMGYVDGTINRPDPLVVVGDAHTNAYAKSSNVNGVVVNGQRYFYSLGPHLSYDPLSLGIVKRQDIRIILQIDDADGFNVLIYQIGGDASLHA
ncbi:MAG: hypothetical protein HY326_06345 [Chloroflexi bacterium]|nr:hypothetical protein [Chloroflexota bacterium]